MNKKLMSIMTLMAMFAFHEASALKINKKKAGQAASTLRHNNQNAGSNDSGSSGDSSDGSSGGGSEKAPAAAPIVTAIVNNAPVAKKVITSQPVAQGIIATQPAPSLSDVEQRMNDAMARAQVTCSFAKQLMPLALAAAKKDALDASIISEIQGVLSLVNKMNLSPTNISSQMSNLHIALDSDSLQFLESRLTNAYLEAIRDNLRAFVANFNINTAKDAVRAAATV